MPRIARDPRLHLPNPTPIHIVHANKPHKPHRQSRWSELEACLCNHSWQTSCLLEASACEREHLNPVQPSSHRITMPIEVSRMAEADIDGAIDTIQQAFATDPYNNWVYPDRAKV
jgi:hypothetical protein